MRPVNLIPPDERRGDSAALRTGSLIYVLVGGLAVLLLGIVVVALTSKQISDRESQKASLEHELASETAKANSVSAFTNFRTMQQNREQTVQSLAQSRFDWQRVLEELARVLPSDVTLESVTGTVSPDVQLDQSGSSGSSDGGSSNLRSQITGPALEIVGCAPTQDAVAAFIAALQDIDGVTRVGLDNSKLPQNDASGFTGEPGNAALSSSSSGCQTTPKTPKFSVVAAFDAAPTAGASGGSSSSTPAPAAPSAASSASSSATATPASNTSGGG